MAIDTRTKRQRAYAVSMFLPLVLPVADSDIANYDRAHLLGSYNITEISINYKITGDSYIVSSITGNSNITSSIVDNSYIVSSITGNSNITRS